MAIRLAATVFTDQLVAVQKWLEKYFDFQPSVDWFESEEGAGKVVCRRSELEVTICGAKERSAEIQLLVDDITELCQQFERDGIEFHVDRDAGERPIIYFPPRSPLCSFVIEEASHES